MIDHKAIDELSSKISNLLPEGVKLLKADLEKKLAQNIEARGHLEIYLQSIKFEHESLIDGLVCYFRDQLAEAR